MIFISYARSDDHWAACLEAELETRGFKTWRDTRDLRDGQDFTSEIEWAIRDATHFVVCLSRDVKDRPDSFVRREIQYALNRASFGRVPDGPPRPIILPVVFPGGELPAHIATLTAILVYSEDDLDRGLDELCDKIAGGFAQRRAGAMSGPAAVTEYLRELHDALSDALHTRIHTMIPLRAESEAGAVETARLAPILKHFPLSDVLKIQDPAASGEETSMPEALRQSRGRLLLLGEPGSGKTSTLLALARDAVVARLDDSREPIPVLVKIASWDGRTPLRDWVIDQAQIEHLRGQRLLHLLDGLDELVALTEHEGQGTEPTSIELRIDFITRVGEELATERVVVSSRVEEFRRLGVLARLRRAVRLQRLEDSQIENYLRSRGQAELWRALRSDDEMLDVVRTPLLLALMSVAFSSSERSVSDLIDLDEDLVFDRYVARRFIHESARPEPLPYDEDRTRVLLADLATYHWFNERDLDRSCFDPKFMAFAERMHLIHRLEEGSHEFIHLKLRDFFALQRLEEKLDTLTPDHDIVRFFLLAGHIGQRAIPLLDRALSHPVDRCRREAVNALERIGGNKVVPGLVKALGDEDKEVRWVAGERLAEMGDEAIDGLFDALTGPYDECRGHAVEQLLGFGARIADRAADALSDPRESVRAAAIGLLGPLTSGGTAPRLEEELADFVDDPSPLMRKAAAEAIAHGTRADLMPRLVALLKDPDPLVKEAGIRALGRRRDPSAAMALTPFLEDTDPALRRLALNALVEVPGDQARVVLDRHLLSFSFDRRDLPLEYAKRPDARASVLVEILASPEAPDMVREYAGYGLKILRPKSPEILRRVVRVAVDEPHTYLRLSAFQVLEASDAHRALETARRLIQSQDVEVAVKAAELLIRQLGEKSLPAVLDLVAEDRTHVTLDYELFGSRTVPRRGGRTIEKALKTARAPWAEAALATLPWIKKSS